MVLVQKTAPLLPALPQQLTPGLILAHGLTLAIIGVIILAALGFEDASSAMVRICLCYCVWRVISHLNTSRIFRPFTVSITANLSIS
jgi:hypothetical protein